MLLQGIVKVSVSDGGGRKVTKTKVDHDGQSEHAVPTNSGVRQRYKKSDLPVSLLEGNKFSREFMPTLCQVLGVQADPWFIMPGELLPILGHIAYAVTEGNEEDSEVIVGNPLHFVVCV